MAECHNGEVLFFFWETVPKPTVESVIDSKHVVDGSIERYKSIFVAGGFYKKKGVYLDETFAIIARGYEVHG